MTNMNLLCLKNHMSNLISCKKAFQFVRIFIIVFFLRDQNQQQQQFLQKCVEQTQANLSNALPDMITNLVQNALKEQNSGNMDKLGKAIEKFTEKTSASEEKDWVVFLIHKSYFYDGNGAKIFNMPDKLETKLKFTFSEFESAAQFGTKLETCIEKFKPKGLIVFPPAVPSMSCNDLHQKLESTIRSEQNGNGLAFSAKKVCILLPSQDKQSALKYLSLRYKDAKVMICDDRFLCTTSGEPSTFKLLTSCLRSVENALKVGARLQEGFTIVESTDRAFGNGGNRSRGYKRRGNFSNRGYGGYYNKRGRGSYY